MIETYSGSIVEFYTLMFFPFKRILYHAYYRFNSFFDILKRKKS